MVAKPVDTIAAAPDSSLEAMQADLESLDTKETAMELISDDHVDLDYSESPPTKGARRPISTTPRMFTPRSSLSPLPPGIPVRSVL